MEGSSKGIESKAAIAGPLLLAAGEALSAQPGDVYGAVSASVPAAFGMLLAAGLILLVGVPAMVLAWLLYRNRLRPRSVVVEPVELPRLRARSVLVEPVVELPRVRRRKRLVRRLARSFLRQRGGIRCADRL